MNKSESVSRMTFHIERGILKQYTGTDAVVHIPPEVKEIGYRAFYGNETMQKLVLSEGTVKLGIQVFSQCKALTDVVFSETLRYIGHEAFADTPWFHAQPDGIVYAGPLAWCVKGDMRQITEIAISSGTKKLCADLFRNATALFAVSLPHTLQEIDDRAFQNCRKLKQIRIPETVVRIGDRAFDECTGLTVYLECRAASIGKVCFMNETTIHLTHMHPENLPVNVRDKAILSFSDAVCDGHVFEEDFVQTMYQFIQNRRRQYYALAVEHWNLLQMMMDANIILPEEVDEILDAVLSQGQADHAAALMRYKQSISVQEEVDLFEESWDSLTLDWDIPIAEKTVEQLQQEWGVKKNTDDTYTLMRYYGTDLDVTVPAQIGDKLISAIGPYALSPFRYGIKRERAQQLEQIRTVTVQEGIIRIANNAFDGCCELYYVELPKSIEQIGADAFARCIWQYQK